MPKIRICACILWAATSRPSSTISALMQRSISASRPGRRCRDTSCRPTARLVAVAAPALAAGGLSVAEIARAAVDLHPRPAARLAVLVGNGAGPPDGARRGKQAFRHVHHGDQRDALRARRRFVAAPPDRAGITGRTLVQVHPHTVANPETLYYAFPEQKRGWEPLRRFEGWLLAAMGRDAGGRGGSPRRTG